MLRDRQMAHMSRAQQVTTVTMANSVQMLDGRHSQKVMRHTHDHPHTPTLISRGAETRNNSWGNTDLLLWWIVTRDR